MSLSIGIVGLPNAGKSTLFNALLGRQVAVVGTHPFTTIKPHEGVVAVPNERLTALSRISADLIKRINADRPAQPLVVPVTVKFIDIAGLVKDAHKGEGLGNQFLAKIREVDAICHVTRLFANPNVGHFYGSIDMIRDIEIVNLELELGEIKKPTLYVLNVDEKQLVGETASQRDSESVEKSQVVKLSSCPAVQLIPVCAQLEMELGELSEEEKREYLEELGIKETGLDKLIREAYQLLDLITFYTIKGGKEIHAWSLRAGETALRASSKVHTDFAKGFIKAEVIDIDELLKIGSWKKAGELGKIRTEGKDYQVKNEEVIEFRFAG